MPGTPSLERVPVNGVTAEKYTLVREKEGAVFGVTFYDLPSGPVPADQLADIAASERDWIVRMANGKVLAETSIKQGPYPGTEVQAQFPRKGKYVSRTYLVERGAVNRIYILVAFGHPIEPGTGDAAKFFDSFKVEMAAPAQ
jgi:hypothetical protein